MANAKKEENKELTDEQKAIQVAAEQEAKDKAEKDKAEKEAEEEEENVEKSDRELSEAILKDELAALDLSKKDMAVAKETFDYNKNKEILYFTKEKGVLALAFANKRDAAERQLKASKEHKVVAFKKAYLSL